MGGLQRGGRFRPRGEEKPAGCGVAVGPRWIQQNLYTLMEGKAAAAIAHRPLTIAALDRLVVMDAGRFVEQGSLAELLAAGGLYARRWAHQRGGFLGMDVER